MSDVEALRRTLRDASSKGDLTAVQQILTNKECTADVVNWRDDVIMSLIEGRLLCACSLWLRGFRVVPTTNASGAGYACSLYAHTRTWVDHGLSVHCCAHVGRVGIC